VTEGSAAVGVYPSISVVLPAYNEEAVIAETVARTDRALTDLGVADFEILVIDDGSGDATAARAAHAGTHLRVSDPSQGHVGPAFLPQGILRSRPARIRTDGT